jgi:hypothetical protein
MQKSSGSVFTPYSQGLLKHIALLLGSLLLVFAAVPACVYAQSATSALVTGIVTDVSGGTIAGAEVILQDQSTGGKQTAATGIDGRYVLPSVAPGLYTVKFTAKGFRTSVVNRLQAEVLESYTVNMTLDVGPTSEVVEVQASTSAELQTTDSSIGNVLGGDALKLLPVYTRSATALMFLQPAVTPPVLGNSTLTKDVSGGAMAGARSEQVTFNLDGGDATSDLEGSNNYISPPGEPQPAPIVPIPQESTEEFRVATSNPNATIGRSSGADVAVVTKHGANAFHGSAYEYHFDDGEGANSWQNNRLSIHKPHQVDNRFGATTGGPIWKDKLFFFTNYEGRRFYDSASITRVVPTDTLRQGVLTFKDSTGTPVPYNFNPANGALASVCGATGNLPCDPRAIGVSAVTMSQIALLPHGNNSSIGDGLNYTGFTANYATPFTEDIAVTRLDYHISPKWSVFGTWHWAKAALVSTSQIQIAPTPQSVSTNPFEPNMYTVSVTGQLTSNLTQVTHGSFLRNWWAWLRKSPQPFVSGSAAAIQLDGEGTGANTSSSTGKLITDPYNVNTQQARARAWDGRDWYIAQDYSWIHGKNAFQFGAAGYIWHDYHLRTDNVLGGLTSGPIYFVQAQNQSQGQFFTPGSAATPPTCSSSAGIITNCLTGGSDARRWNGLYASLMGVVDHSAQIATRDGSFNANPLGTPLFDNVTIPSYYLYFQNVWQAKPGLTITYGVDWGVQLTPSEAAGKEVVWTYSNSGAPLNYYEYLQNRASLLNQGVTTTTNPATGRVLAVNAFNPVFSLTPVNNLATPFNGQMRHTEWGDFGPRIAIAWQPQWNNKIFGNKATVIRGGYARVFDRTSAVGEALNPLLTGGLASGDQCNAPVTTNPGGGPGAFGGCTSLTSTNASNAFRIGPDGNSVPIPAATSLPIPFTPSGTAFLPQHLSSSLDPFTTPGYAHSVDFSIQRALPGHMFVEIGYIGRFSRNLPQTFQLNAPDPYMKDAQSGQTLVQAFANLGLAQNAKTPLAQTPVQPFFENIIGTYNCQNASTVIPGMKKNFANCSQMLMSQDASNKYLGAMDLGDFTTNELNVDTANYIDNMQIFEWSATSDKGWSDYNAAFLNVNKSFGRGLQFQFNWTWSHAIGIQGINQQYLYSVNSPYNLNLDKSSEPFDHKHTLNAWWYYQLPFGSGRQFRTNQGFIDRVIGGWYTSGIYTFYTGLPMYISAQGNFGAYLLSNGDVAVSSLGSLHGLEGRHDGSLPGGVPNIFGNPSAVLGSLSVPNISQIGQNPFDQLRMIPSWNVDLSFGKNIVASERFKVMFSADMLNAFNHIIFNEPQLNTSGTSFGEFTTQANDPRRILLGLRFEF